MDVLVVFHFRGEDIITARRHRFRRNTNLQLGAPVRINNLRYKVIGVGREGLVPSVDLLHA